MWAFEEYLLLQGYTKYKTDGSLVNNNATYSTLNNLSFLFKKNNVEIYMGLNEYKKHYPVLLNPSIWIKKENTVYLASDNEIYNIYKEIGDFKFEELIKNANSDKNNNKKKYIFYTI